MQLNLLVRLPNIKITDRNCAESEYEWVESGNRSLQLQYDDQPFIQYEYPVFDVFNVPKTNKPFHHVFDHLTGNMITKGSGGLYSHHKGIFFG